MTDALRSVSRVRLYEQVLDRLRDYVAQNGLRRGDRLPPERELAQQLAVSRVSVKQAIIVLEVQGLVEARQGGGTFLLADGFDIEPVERLADRRRRLPEVLEAREAMETKLAELAAERRSPSDLDAMNQALEDMAQDIAAGGHGTEGDRLFHGAVAAAASSPLLAEFMRSIADQVAESRGESLRQPGRPRRSLAQHRSVYNAIEARKPAQAAAAMRRHLRTVAKVRLLDWDPDDT